MIGTWIKQQFFHVAFVFAKLSWTKRALHFNSIKIHIENAIPKNVNFAAAKEFFPAVKRKCFE